MERRSEPGLDTRRKQTTTMMLPIETTTTAPLPARDGSTVPVGSPVRYAVDGDRVLVRATDGRGAVIPLALAQTALAALVVAAPSDPVDALLSQVGGVAEARTLPSHRPAVKNGKAPSDHIVTHADLAQCRTARELCAMTGLDWRVEAVPLQTADGRTSSARSIRRSDTGAELSFESPRYAVVQNEAALGLLDPIVAAGCPFVGAGWVSGGKKVFAQADLGRVSEIVPGGRMKHLLHVRAGHSSGSGGAVYVVRSDVRIVCRNTLARATSTGARLFRVRHVGNAAQRVDDVRAAIEKMLSEIDAQVSVYREMALRPFSDADVRATLDAILGTAEERAKEQWRKDADALMASMWRNGSAIGANLAGRTAWGALNIITEYADHKMAARSASPEMSRIEGDAARLKSHAYDVILERVGLAAN